jgi:hypothetical protein
LAGKLIEGSGSLRAVGYELLDAVWIAIKGDALMSTPYQTARHVRTHAAQSNHAQLHLFTPFQNSCQLRAFSTQQKQVATTAR